MGQGERNETDSAWREEQVVRSRSHGERAGLPSPLIENAEVALRTAFALHDAMRKLARGDIQ